MRVFFAFLLGVVVTIGGAYLHDQLATAGTQRFVNWDAVNDSTRGAVDSARTRWDRWTN